MVLKSVLLKVVELTYFLGCLYCYKRGKFSLNVLWAVVYSCPHGTTYDTLNNTVCVHSSLTTLQFVRGWIEVR